MNIRSFSGTHDWHPTVLADTDAQDSGTADDIIEAIENDRCPRCRGPLPTPPEYPAGSRITKCRSIPICGRCGCDEVFQALDAACGIGWGLEPAGGWPVPGDEINERRSRFMAQTKPAIITTDGNLITEDGSVQVTIQGDTGGWLQYGEPSADGVV